MAVPRSDDPSAIAGPPEIKAPPLPSDPAPCCTAAAPICACNQCVTREELALVSCIVPEDDPDSINDCCPPDVRPPPPPAECCTAAAPICSCVGCVTLADLAAITCPANPAEPFDCCNDDGGSPDVDPDDDPEEDPGLPGLPGPPDVVPPVPFDGQDCCDEESLCCCGACRPPVICAAITCIGLPVDIPDDYRPCCGDDIGGDTDPDEEDPEEEEPPPKSVEPAECCTEDKPKCACGTCVFDPDDRLACKPAPGWDGDCCPDDPEPAPPPPPVIAECCTEEAPACCCGGCATEEFCNVVDCLPDAPAGCCGDEEPVEEPPEDPPAPETCCKEGLQCCCGGCMKPDICARIRCALDPDDDGTCCGPEEEAPEEEEPVKEGRADCCTGFKQCCCGKCRTGRECALIDCAVLPGPDTCCDGDDDDEKMFDFDFGIDVQKK